MTKLTAKVAMTCSEVVPGIILSLVVRAMTLSLLIRAITCSLVAMEMIMSLTLVTTASTEQAQFYFAILPLAKTPSTVVLVTIPWMLIIQQGITLSTVMLVMIA